MPKVWLAGLLVVLAGTLGCSKKVPVGPPPASNEPQAVLMAGELRVRMPGDLTKTIDDRVSGQFLFHASLIPRVKTVKCVSKDGEFHAYVQAYVTNKVEFVQQIRAAIAEVKLPWNAANPEVRIMQAEVPMVYPAAAEDIEVVLDKNKLMILGVTERDVITQIPKTMADLSESGKAVREHPGTKVIQLKEGKQCFLQDIATVKEVKRPTCLLRFYPSGGTQE
jgi:multidrug efflux pump subunit AcrB